MFNILELHFFHYIMFRLTQHLNASLPGSRVQVIDIGGVGIAPVFLVNRTVFTIQYSYVRSGSTAVIGDTIRIFVD